MDLLEYPIEYHKPVDGEKLLTCAIVLCIVGIFIYMWKRRGLPVTFRH